MATKEVMVSAPVIVGLYDRTFPSGSWREAWRRHRWVYFGLGATWIPLAFAVAFAGSRGSSVGYEAGASWSAYALADRRLRRRRENDASWRDQDSEEMER